MNNELARLEDLSNEFEELLRKLRNLEAVTAEAERMEVHAFVVLSTRYYNSCYATAQLLRAMELLETSTPESREMISADIRKLKQGAAGVHGVAVSKPDEVKDLLSKAQKVLEEGERFVQARIES